jgi:GDP-mannose pyrophosphatase NudK
MHFFLGEYSPGMKVSSGGGEPEEQEDIEVVELSVDEAYAMVESGEIKDAKTIILLQYAKIKGF